MVQARLERGFVDAKTATRHFGWNYDTYIQHERGINGLRKAVIDKYAKAYRVSRAWLATGEGSKGERLVPVVGHVGAGAVYYPFEPGEPADDVPAPEGANDNTVAAEIRGDSLGSLFDRWLVFYDRVEAKPDSSMLNRLCVIGLEDDRVMVKQIRRGRDGLYNLFSNFDPPVYDVAVRWCAVVKNMSPR